jgi:hypothetical protein
MGIPFTFEDGSIAKLEPGEYAAFMEAYQEAFGKPPKLPTHAELVRSLMAGKRSEVVEVDTTKNEAVTELHVVATPRPKKNVIPVTESEGCVVEKILEHPEGISTKSLSIEMGWGHTKTSRVVTLMARQRRAVERIPGRKEYRPTKEALTAQFEVVHYPTLYVSE